LVSMAQAAVDGEIICALCFDYGQKAAEQEIESAKKICEHYKVPCNIVNLDFMKDIAKGALLEKDVEIPRITEDNLRCSLEINFESAKAVWVPNRNAILVSIGAAYAEKLNADTIVTGFNAEEAITFLDNSLQFVNAMNQLFRFSTQNKPRLISFTQSYNKVGVVNLGFKLKVPFEHLYSCYRGAPKLCGECESCARLKRAFRSAGQWEAVRKKFKGEK